MWNCCFNPFFNINNFNYYCFILYRKKVPNNVNIYLNEKDSAGQQRHLYFMNFNFNFSDWKKNRTFFVWIEQVVSRIMHPQNWCRLIFFVSHLSFLSHSESSINKKVKVCLQSLVVQLCKQGGQSVAAAWLFRSSHSNNNHGNNNDVALKTTSRQMVFLFLHV